MLPNITKIEFGCIVELKVLFVKEVESMVISGLFKGAQKLE